MLFRNIANLNFIYHLYVTVLKELFCKDRLELYTDIDSIVLESP